MLVNSFQKIQRLTSKGQITLPVSWRREFNVNQVMVTESGGRIEIMPVRHVNNSEYTVFDAIRDNKGKGIKAKDLLKILKKIS